MKRLLVNNLLPLSQFSVRRGASFAAIALATFLLSCTNAEAGEDCRTFKKSSCLIEFGERVADPALPTVCPDVNCLAPSNVYPDGYCPLSSDIGYVKFYSINATEYNEQTDIVTEDNGFSGRVGTVGYKVCHYSTYCGGCELVEELDVRICVKAFEAIESLQTFTLDSPQIECTPE